MLGISLGLQSAETSNIKTSKSFIFDINITTTFSLPLEATGTYNFKVYWGDGTYSTITTYNQAEVTHTYASAGTYTVIINGTLIGWRSNNTWTHRTNITNIKQWGQLKFTNSNGAFYGCSNLTITATDILDLTGTTNLTYFFRGCAKITTIPNIHLWDVSNITHMLSMFNGCVLFNQSLVGWNCVKVTNYSKMFIDASSYNQDLSQVIKLNSVPPDGDVTLYPAGAYLSTANYDLLLVALAGQTTVNTGISLSVGTTKYTNAGDVATARNFLATTKSWIITDGGAV
jgi:hypothetical protein